MEIRGVSSSTAVRPTAFQPTESGTASPSTSAEDTGAVAAGDTEKSSGAGFISPFMRYDQGARVAVLYFRDFDTGETQDQIPSQRVVEEYRRTANRLSQEDERKSAAAKSGADGSAGGAGGGPGGSSGSGYGTTTSGSGLGGTTAGRSVGVSFASAPSGSGTAAGPAAAAPPTSGFTPATTGGYTGGSPGALVSVTV